MRLILKIILLLIHQWVYYAGSNMVRRLIIHYLCDYAGRRDDKNGIIKLFCVELVLPHYIVWMSKVIQKVLDMNPACVLLKGNLLIPGMLF